VAGARLYLARRRVGQMDSPFWTANEVDSGNNITKGGLMGFCSNQWLNTGGGYRLSTHIPVSVDIEAGTPFDTWSGEHKVVLEIKGTRESMEYMEFQLTKPEAEQCANAIIRVCSDKVRERLALQILKGMTPAKLLEILTSILKVRLRDAPKRAKK